MKFNLFCRKLFIQLAVLYSLSFTVACADGQSGGNENTALKINGISYTSPSKPVGAQIYQSMVNVNANYVAIIPFGFVRDGAAKLEYNLPWQWWGERSAGVTSLTRDAHAAGLKVMIKPQVWLVNGGFTGTFNLSAEADWQTFEQGYYNYILHFAQLADSLQAELFCVGTEWKIFAATRPAFWGRLIDSVRANYHGAITYAGNWDSYQQFPHWAKLDLMGIDAYFPLSIGTTASPTELQGAWQPAKAALKAQHDSLGLPVLFTEYGYRSVDNCTERPWESGRGGTVNLSAQANAYQALFAAFWQEPWFAGGFLWKWHSPHPQAGGPSNNRFTPQNKPAEQLVKEWYRGKRPN